jgi:4-hydroxybenzoate polyprenyltransferase
MKYLKLIRFQNLLMLALMQLIVRYGFLKQQNIYLALSDFQFGLLVLATVCIAAGGYIINDIFDVETDSENKPNRIVIGTEISEDLAYNLYFGTTVVGVIIGFYLSNSIGLNSFAGAFIITAALLYLYANSLKQSLLIGNIIIALLLSFSVLIIPLFDLLPVIYDGNRAEMGLIFKILLDYAVFAFIINFIREIVKDLEDINGDYNQGMNTLPIAIGVNRTTKIVFGVTVAFAVYFLYYVYQYYFINHLIISTIYTIVFILAPLIYFTISIYKAKTQAEFSHLSKILKWVLFFGILSIAIVTYNVHHNV